MPPTILTLVCHGATTATRLSAFPGDEELERSGAAAATAARSRLRRVDAAWTSPALRARQTAAALGLDAVPEVALRDLDYGHWAGRRLDDVATSDPAGVAAWLSDPGVAPHGGETIGALLHRTACWLQTIGGTHGRLVAVTHAAVIRATVVAALVAPPVAFWRIDIAPLGVVRLQGGTGRWTLTALGRSSPSRGRS